jgi:hypothetical protein
VIAIKLSAEKREKKMKNYFKYSILATLILVTIIGITYAQPVPIGADRQPVPFESNPSSYSVTGSMGLVNFPTSMWDGSLLSSGNFKLGSGFSSPASLSIKDFDVPSSPFAIEWVDLKIKYHVPVALVDDTYKLEYTTDGVTWIKVTEDTSTAFDVGGNPPPVVAFGQIEPSSGLAWTWSDIQNLQLRVYCTKGGFGYDNKDIYVYEVWATVYPLPLPPTSSPTMSIQPTNGTTGSSGMYGPSTYFVDVYVMDMVEMLGFEILISFDPGVLQPVAVYNYYPFKTEVFTPLLDPSGFVSMAYWTFGGDGFGFWGNGPIARIYFTVVGPPTADQTPLTFDVDKITDINGDPIVHATYGGMFEVAHYLSAVVGPGDLTPITIDKTSPVGTHWHENYPTYSLEYDILDWVDNGDGVLSYCDKIELAPDEWYHVEEVTITIWWTIKAGDPYGWDGMPGAGEPEMPTDELDLPEPIGTGWHQIWMEDFYSLTFTITSWEDNGDGVFSESDQFDFEYDFDPGIPHWAHLDAVSTDIIVTPTDPPPIPEFPFGISLLMLLAPIVPLAYLWRLRKKVTKQ